MQVIAQQLIRKEHIGANNKRCDANSNNMNTANNNCTVSTNFGDGARVVSKLPVYVSDDRIKFSRKLHKKFCVSVDPGFICTAHNLFYLGTINGVKSTNQFPALLCWVRILTVVGYLVSVCIPAIALTVYYVGFWNPHYIDKIPNINDTTVHKLNHMNGGDQQCQPCQCKQQIVDKNISRNNIALESVILLAKFNNDTFV